VFLLRLARQPFAVLARLLFILFQRSARALLPLLTLAARVLLPRLTFPITPHGFLSSSLLEGLKALPLERGCTFAGERLQTRIARRNPETVIQEVDRNLVDRLVARLCEDPDERLFARAGLLLAARFLRLPPRFFGLPPLLRASSLNRGLASSYLCGNP
jgi:hypothetical protein